MVQWKGKSQNGYKETKHAKFNENYICPRTCGYQRVRNVSFWKILLDLFSCNHHFNIRPLPYDQRIKKRKHKYFNGKLRESEE